METIIVISMSRWDGKYSSAAFSLAKEFSKKHRVFYVDHPFTIKDFFYDYSSQDIQSRKEALLFGRNVYKHLKGLPNNFFAVTPRLTFSINKFPPGKLYNTLLNFNNKIASYSIKKVIEDHNIEDYIFFNSYNPFFNQILPKDHPPKFKVYQSRDNISESLYVAKHGPRLEREAIEASDYSFATSKELCRLLSTSSKNVVHLPNAADYSIFERSLHDLPKPKELIGVDKKIIGYMGNISLRMDYELLKKIAEVHKDKIILMVGPRNEKKFTKIDFDEFPNIIFTGGKDINELPSYLKYMDCAIIPFKYNKLTASIYPLKVNEYLAAGKPVVSTNFSEDIGDFRDVIYLADDHESFLRQIDKALEKESEELVKKRFKIAENNTWSARVETFWEYVSNDYQKTQA